MPINALPCSWVADGYLVFVGRLSREEGPETAIRLAKAAGLPLRIAAKVPRSETRYYRERIEPLIDGEQIEILGELDDTAKGALMSKASALLFPIDWPLPGALRGASERADAQTRCSIAPEASGHT